MNTTEVQIPTVSLSGWENGDHLDAGKVTTVGDAVTKFGFVAFTDHGIDTKWFDSFYEIVRQVFHLGEDVLSQYENPENGRQTGFSPLGTETSKGHKEPNMMRFWQARRKGNVLKNIWPTEVPLFEQFVMELFGKLDALSFPIFEMLAQYAGVPKSYFTDMIEDGDSLLRVLNYPARSPSDPLTAPGSGAHEDICLGTMLITSKPGLQILTQEYGWLPVTNPPGSIIFNTGDMAELHTNWHRDFPHNVAYPSTTHRVVRSGDERFSAPFFIHPRAGVELLPGLTAHEVLMRRLRQIGMAS